MCEVGLELYPLSSRLPNMDLWQVHVMDCRGFNSSVGYGHYDSSLTLLLIPFFLGIFMRTPTYNHMIQTWPWLIYPLSTLLSTFISTL